MQNLRLLFTTITLIALMWAASLAALTIFAMAVGAW